MMERRGTYRWERIRLKAQTVKSVARLIGRGQVPGCGAQFADIEPPGLTLRFTAAAGIWYLRHRKGTVRLGPMAALDLPAARHAAKVVCTDLKTELDLFQYARLFEMRTRAGATIWEAHGCAFREVIEQSRGRYRPTSDQAVPDASHMPRHNSSSSLSPRGSCTEDALAVTARAYEAVEWADFAV